MGSQTESTSDLPLQGYSKCILHAFDRIDRAHLSPGIPPIEKRVLEVIQAGDSEKEILSVAFKALFRPDRDPKKVLETCSKEAPHFSAQHIEDAVDPGLLFPAAKIFASTSPNSINKFPLHLLKEEELLVIGRIVIERNHYMFYFFLRSIEVSEKARIVFFEVCLEKDIRMCLDKLLCFRITDKKYLFRVALIAIERNEFYSFYRSLQNLNLGEEYETEIAIRVVTKNSRGFLDKFSIKSPENVLRIARAWVESHSNHCTYFINDFLTALQIQDPELQFQVFHTFLIVVKNTERPLEFAKVVVENPNVIIGHKLVLLRQLAVSNPRDTALAIKELMNLWELDLTQDERLDIALICAGESPFTVMRHIDKFGIHDQEKRVQVVMRCYDTEPASVAPDLKRANLDEENRLRFSRMYMDIYPALATNHYDKFEIVDEETRYHDACRLARIDAKTVAENFEKFRLENREFVADIAIVCCTKSPRTVADNLSSFGNIKATKARTMKWLLQRAYLLDPTVVFRLYPQLRESLFPKFPFELMYAPHLGHDPVKCRDILFRFVSAHFPIGQVDWFFRDFDALQNKQIQKEVLSDFTALLFFERELGGSLSFLTQEGLVRAVLIQRLPHMRIYWMRDIVRLSCHDEVRSRFIRWNKELLLPSHSHARSATLLLRSILAPICSDDRDEVDQFVRFMGKLRKFMKDAKKSHLLLEVLTRMIEKPTLSDSIKRSVICRLQDPKTLLKNLEYLTIILFHEEALEDKKSFEKMFYDIIQNLFPHANCHPGKVHEVFLRWRDPLAIFVYASKLLSLQDPRIPQALSDLVTFVVEGTHDKMRYDPDRNPHCRKLIEEHPKTFELWMGGAQMKCRASSLPTSFSPIKWLQTKLMMDHHAGFPLRYLPEFFRAQEIEFEVGESPEIEFEKACVEFTKAHATEELLERLEVMQEFLERVKSDSEFLNDIKGLRSELVKPTRQGSVVVDTDDPQDLFLCGTEVTGSCQRIDGSPDLNKGLLGFLLHGQVRLIAVKDRRGRILGRALIRLLFSEKGPVLFLERYYGSDKYQGDVLKMAQFRSEELGLPLTSKNFGLEAEHRDLYPLRSLGGPSPFEYVDGVRGMVWRGIYTIG